jgi:hypothetical protein
MNKLRQKYNICEYKIRKFFGIKLAHEKQREAEDEAKYIAEGQPDPKVYQMYYCFEYDNEKHTLNLSRVGVNPRLYHINKRSSDIEEQNHRWAKEFVNRFGFTFEDRDDYNKHDWWKSSYLNLFEVVDAEEAQRIVVELADRMFPGHGAITFTPMDDRNPGGLWMYFYAKAMPLRDNNPKFGNRYTEFETREFELGIRQDTEYARLYFSFAYWGFYWRYGVPPCGRHNNYDYKIDYYTETNGAKYVPKLPLYIPENLRNVPHDEFVWTVGKTTVRKLRDSEFRDRDYSRDWGVFNIHEDDDFYMTYKHRLQAIELMHTFMSGSK